MKKKNVINLIKWYSENNDAAFRAEAYEIAKDFDKSGDSKLAEYIMAMLANTDTFAPRYDEDALTFFKKVEMSHKTLLLPEVIKDDVFGIVNAVGHNIGVNKFLFQGAPGTGKTEIVQHLARILDRELFMVDFSSVIDSKLGQTSKNIVALFKEINELSNPQKVIVLFDEIDALALDRNNSNDLREMGRATSSILKEFDNLNKSIVLIATTNLFDAFDKALTRRFDSVISFNRYGREDLTEIAELILNDYLSIAKFAGSNIRLFRKIISLLDPIPYPGDLNNIIKTSIAFSNPDSKYDYLKRLYKTVSDEKVVDIKRLQKQGFTEREIKILT